jgi:hypothetical protein
MRNTIILVTALFLIFLSACKTTGEDAVNITTKIPSQEPSEVEVQSPAPTSQKNETVETSEPVKETEPVNVAHGKTTTDEPRNNLPQVPGVAKEMQKAQFWMNLSKNGDEIILSKEEIRRYNDINFNKLPFLTDPEKFPQSVSGRKVLQHIKELSTPPQSVRYDESGKKYQEADYDALRENLNLSNIPELIKVKYGITVKRTLMRTWPANKEAYDNPKNMRNDLFTETAVYPAEPVAVYHTSEDGKWYFAHIYNYMAWIPASDVALCSWNKIEEFLSNKEKLVITGAFIHTPVSQDKRVSGLQLDMGVALPLKSDNNGSYTVSFPAADGMGNLEYLDVMITATDSVQRGYLDYTTGNVLKQAFKFLGETYGWGGMNNARDCSSFILDIYRTFGIKLPRNTGQQEQVEGAISLRGKSRQDRLDIIDGLRPGSVLYMPGHAMMYLGKWQNRHYIIHDVATVYEKTGDGSLKPVVLYQVAVTPLDVCTSKGIEYLMALTGVVSIGSK